MNVPPPSRRQRMVMKFLKGLGFGIAGIAAVSIGVQYQVLWIFGAGLLLLTAAYVYIFEIKI